MKKNTEYIYAMFEQSEFERVDDIFLDMYQKGYTIKYDLPPYNGSAIAENMKNARATMLMVSPKAVASAQVAEFIRAADSYDKQIIPYFLDNPATFSMPTSTAVLLDGVSRIDGYAIADRAARAQRAGEELKKYFPKKRSANIYTYAAIVAVAVIAVVALVKLLPAEAPEIPTPPQGGGTAPISDGTLSTDELVTLSQKSAVKVYNYSDDEDTMATGSGFFVSEDGLIVTNYHVVSDYDNVAVSIKGDDNYYDVTVVAYDAEADLAVLDYGYSVDTWLTLNTEKSVVGEQVWVAGYPIGVDLIVSNGIVSNNEHYAADEKLEYITITAPISHGSSGSAVLNVYGEVIAVETATYEDGENLNLARPAKYVEKLLAKAR